MVELESQEQYLQSIKKIKQIEDKTQKEIEDYKKNSETKIKKLEDDLEKAISDAKTKGEELIDQSIQKAKETANTETIKLIEEAKTKAENIVSEIHAQDNQEIIDVLLKGVK